MGSPVGTIRAPGGDRHFLEEYIRVASAALSLVRAAECQHFARHELTRPVLDVGCGDGLFAHTVYRQPLDVGLDISRREVRRALRRGAYRLPIRGSVTDIPAPDGAFNTVISNCVIEHIAPLERAFAEIHRVLAPGGRYLFSSHSHLYDDYLYYPRRLKELKLPRLADGYARFIRRLFKHFNCHSPEGWTELLQAAGFDRVETWYYLPRETEETFDRLLPLAGPSFLFQRALGRWVLGPRRLIWRLWRSRLEPLHRPDPELGGALFVVAHKE